MDDTSVTGSNTDKGRRLIFLASLYGACIGIAVVSHLAKSEAIHFAYSEANPLGIRSLVTLHRYPKQQDIFWYLFGLAVPLAIASIMAFLAKYRMGHARWARETPWIWSLGIYFLQFPAVVLGAWFGWISATLHVALLIALPFGLSHLKFIDQPVFGENDSRAIPTRRWLDIFLRYVLPFCVLFFIYWNPSYPRAVLGTIDEEQHYAWMEAMLRGRWPGADTAFKYGALLEWFIYWLMILKGFTMKSFRWISAASQMLAAAIALLAVIRFTKSKWAPWAGLIIILAFNMIDVSGQGQFFGIRGAFPLAAILAFHLRTDRRNIKYLLTGLLAALSLGISVEYGLAVLIAVSAGIFLENFEGKGFRPRPFAMAAGFFVLGIGLVAGPFAICYAARGSMGLFVTRFAEYMNAFRAGFLNLPFPPFPWLDLHDPAKFLMNKNLLMYLPPAIYVLAAVELIARRFAGSWNHEATARFSLLLFGVLAFRATLGRSDFEHMAYSNFAATVLFAWELEQAAQDFTARWWHGGRKIPGIVFPAAATMAIIIIFSVLSWGRTAIVIGRFSDNFIGWTPEVAHQEWKHENWVELNLPEAGGVWLPAQLAAEIEQTTAYIKSHTRPDEPIAIMPCSGSYYFFAHRPSATRFDIANDAVTEAQRKEYAAALRNKKPLVFIFSWCDVDMPFLSEHTEEAEVLMKVYTTKEKLMGAYVLDPKKLLDLYPPE